MRHICLLIYIACLLLVTPSYAKDAIILSDHGPKTHATVNTIIASLGEQEATILFNDGPWAFTNDVTVPTNITLAVERGSVISVSSNKTLLLNSYIEAGDYQIFSGEGTVTGTCRNAYISSYWGTNHLGYGSSSLVHTPTLIATSVVLQTVSSSNLATSLAADLVVSNALESSITSHVARVFELVAVATNGAMTCTVNTGTNTPMTCIFTTDNCYSNSAYYIPTAGYYRFTASMCATQSPATPIFMSAVLSLNEFTSTSTNLIGGSYDNWYCPFSSLFNCLIRLSFTQTRYANTNTHYTLYIGSVSTSLNTASLYFTVEKLK